MLPPSAVWTVRLCPTVPQSPSWPVTSLTDGTGPYQAVLVELAVLVSAPEGCRTLTTALRAPQLTGGIAELVDELAGAEAGGVWTRLQTILSGGDPIHDNLTTYRRWAGTITRFSFETWDLTESR